MLPNYELQRAIITELSKLSTPVYDGVPTGKKLPYIRYDSDILEDEATKTEAYFKETVYLNIFSNTTSYAEAKQIMSEVYDAIKAMGNTITGYTIDSKKITQAHSNYDVASQTRQITLILEFKLSRQED